MLLRLKSLELQGFKSFPDKTTLSFGSGITAIVGPNGSGKSNISDAVRWVLGEQSTKTLRGSKMEDVIFGGTEKRRPVGYAEVSLTIDNSDGELAIGYNEVTITRRYYRSGDSEFYLNRKAVRLRDIHELLMDTGLGRDGYSIIGQGRIDEILSLKSEDRREIFEEAAGISKFRHRKEEAERKLDATEENLMRIRDIIVELEGQVSPLQVQAEKAKQFLKIRDELRDLEVDLWMHQLDQNHETLSILQNDYQIACAQFERGQITVDELYTEVEQISEQMRAKDREIEAGKEQHFAIEREQNDKRHEISVLENTIANHKENIQRITTELSEEKQRANGLEVQITQKEKRITELKMQSENWSEQIENIQNAIQIAIESFDDVATTLDALQAKREEANCCLSQFQVQKANIETELSAHFERKEELVQQKKQNKEAFDTTQQQVHLLKKEKEQAEEMLASSQNVLSGVILKKQKKSERMEEAEHAYAQQNAQLQAIEHKIHILKEMEQDLEGFSRSVKLIYRAGQREELAGIHGTVAQLVRVPQKYTLAIETILGGALQNIVVEDEAAAKAGISFLKSGNGGRATFLPLTTIQGAILCETTLPKQEGFLGIASELVSFDAQYQHIFEYLLGRIVVVDHIDHASKIARNFKYKFRIVTLDGQIIHAGGSYTGGSNCKNNGFLSRTNEIAKLEETRIQVKKQLDVFIHEKNQAEREVLTLSQEFDTYQKDKRQAEDALLRITTELSHYQEWIERAQNSDDLLNAEIAKKEQAIQQLSKDKINLQKESNALWQEREELSQKIETLLQSHSELTEKRGVLSDQLSSLRTNFAAIQAEQTELMRGVEELRSLQDAIHGDNDSKRKLIEQYQIKNKELTTQILLIDQQVNSLHHISHEITVKISNLTEEKLELEAQRNKKEKESKDKNDEILNLERERLRLEGKISSAENEEHQITARLWDTYELTITAAQERRHPIGQMNTLLSRITQLKNEKKTLGNVNIGAIEEYDRVSERYFFLKEQRDDLEKAKAELNQKITEITLQMQKIFGEQFHIINEKFGETFHEIFGGGKAELSLENPEDILHCGIEIRVQPPGKSLRTITLLSGGERAFVAIALYFAIMKVRPTPFCVLDEIEAALDDVNVVRYAHYLRKLTESTQFIVITHRRGTMEEADVLYGVTMQEQGVSKMLSISIAEVEKELNITLK